MRRFANALYHAQLVEESLAFAGRELLGRSGTSSYRPRGSALVTKIRHRSTDLYVLDEIVRHRVYAFPLEVEERLRRLGRAPRVVDAGANVGLFAVEVFERFPAATITAFEPDPANAAVLEETIRANGLQGRWRIVRACVGTEAGTVMFAAHGHVESRIESSPGAIAVSSVDVFPYLEEADLFKMDIEGSEWPILSDSRLAELDTLVLVFEYHRRTSPHDDPQRAATELLAHAGFAARVVELPRQPEGTGIVWGWK